MDVIDVTDVWPVWEFQCPNCDEIQHVDDGDFTFSDVCEGRCEECGSYLSIHK